MAPTTQSNNRCLGWVSSAQRLLLFCIHRRVTKKFGGGLIGGIVWVCWVNLYPLKFSFIGCVVCVHH